MITQYQKLFDVLFCGMMYIKHTYGELWSSDKIYVYVRTFIYIYTYIYIHMPFYRTIFETKILTSDILHLFLFQYSTVNFKHKLHDFQNCGVL